MDYVFFGLSVFLLALGNSVGTDPDCKYQSCSSVGYRPALCRVGCTRAISSVTLSKKLSKSACVSGKSYGLFKEKRIIWVKSGCRATFKVCFEGKTGPKPTPPPAKPPTKGQVCKTEVCSSIGFRPALCRLKTAGEVVSFSMVKKLSKSSCVRSKSFGIFEARKIVWVKSGCRAQFKVCYKSTTTAKPTTPTAAPPTPSAEPPATGGACRAQSCSSWKFRPAVCRVKNPPGEIVSVVVGRQESRSECKKGKSFGFNKDKNVIWVKDGCRASFQVCFKVKTSECGTACGRNAECVSGSCLCQKGYIGDPYQKCDDACTCTVSGDPHYRTFDKQIIHFQGICMYTLVMLQDKTDPCYFNVEVKNQRRGKNKKVSYTRLVDIEIYGVKIRFHQKKIVYIRGKKTYLPINMLDGKLKIVMAGDFVRLTTKCGVSVSWNGRSQVSVQIPKSYGNSVSGLCGNCNGKKDDLKTKEGKDVSKESNKFQLIGESYEVTDDSDQQHETCATEEIDDEVCDEEKRGAASDVKYCGYLDVTKAHLSPFKEALVLYPTIASEMFESCIYDVCSNYDDSDKLKEAICNNLEAFATDMEARGLTIEWRKSDFCEMQCPENMEYSNKVNGCPATCVDITPDPADCNVPSVEGCQCKEGYVLSDRGCVSKAQCGCATSDSYLPLNFKMTSNDCTKTIECKLQGGTATLITTENDVKCHENALCGLSDGEPKCVCKENFFGDGVEKCEPVCNGRTCAERASCVESRCVCDTGYHGNAYKECEPVGVCGGKQCHGYAGCINYHCICNDGYIGDGYKECKSLCGGNECASNSECVDNVCKCKSGYHGNGYVLCEPLSVCNGTTCADNAACLNFQCVCRVGYYGKGYEQCEKLCDGYRCAENAQCTDDDECECIEGYHGDGKVRCEREGVCDNKSCADDAECINYSCICKTGYTGDGYKHCQPLCDGKPCAKNAKCVDEKECECIPGFQGNGYIKCEPENQCGGKKCTTNAVCINYQCHCLDEFYGDGYVKCKRLCGGIPCTKDAYCYEGQCECSDGYHGNGYIQCEPTEMCGNRTCATNAKCVNFQCVCKDKYVGDGYVECEELCDGKPCAEFAKCVNGECKCMEGFHGQGLVLCEPVTKCGGRECKPNAVCKNYQCMCKDNFYGDGYKKCFPLCYGRKCAPNAACVNGECQCKEGYHGTPTIECEPITECGGKKCTAHATCKNYYCQCDDGYTGDGYEKCDELCDGKVCKPNSQCIDGKCVCNQGLHGDGAILCEPIDKCGGRSCKAYGHCYNYKCVCDEGYSGNAYEKCRQLCNARHCAEYAFCDESSNKCRCKDGYHGNPHIKCEPRRYCDGKECAPYSDCINYQCVCRSGYISDGNNGCKQLCNNQECGENAVCNNGNCECVADYHGNPLILCEPNGICGGKECDEYADCVNYVCQCRDGYYGDPYSTCEPLCGYSKCAEYATCKNEQCVCLPGYHGDGHVKCEGENVCNGQACAENAACINYNCVCKHGYYGDGKDSCEPYCDGRMCGKGAVCVDDKCKCPDNYHGNPHKRCEPYGICDGLKCADYADCENYKCICRKGYVGDGSKLCTPLCNGSECVLLSTCVNEECKCIEGYHGNGYVKCERDTVCGGKTCGLGATCVNFQCICPYGYIGDGYKGCEALCDGKTCKPNSHCLDGECMCDDGYHGDGLIKCEPRGICGGKRCGEYARCVNYVCQCLDGYAGDPCEELCGDVKCVSHAYCNIQRDPPTCECMDDYHGDGNIECEPPGVCGGKRCGDNYMCKQRTCVCPEGYFDDGEDTCEKLCFGKRCGKYASCTDHGCACDDGYHGNPFWKCEERHLCDGKMCGRNAECSNYVCMCKENFHGDPYDSCQESCDGKLCVDNSECIDGKCECIDGYHGFGAWKCEPDGICDGKPCSVNAKCINFMCICESGYFGDGYKSCKAFCGGGVCADNAHCDADKCKCDDGYHGDGYAKCEPVGLCGGRKCHKHAVCENYKCRCRTGFSGDGYEVCELDGYCKGVKCADNAECVNNRCVCKDGYLGNGFKECSQTCICTAHGDPHYTRYDGQKMNFQGGCKYTLTKLTRFIDGHYFNIEVKNQKRGKNKKISWTRTVDVQIGGKTIRLMQDKVVYINKYRQYLPIHDKAGEFKVFLSGEWVRVTATCGLSVSWNGVDSATIKIPVKYGEFVTGICGNCNGIKDDDKTKDGEDVSGYSKRDKYFKIGESFKVPDDTVDPDEIDEECLVEEEAAPECTPESIEAAKVPSVCGLLYYSYVNSPFRDCILQYPKLADTKYKSCIYDACETFDDPKEDATKIGCGYYEEFAEQCSLRGYHTEWRSPSVCPLNCGPNMKYSAHMSGCPATCLDPKPVCGELPPSEGCECVPGYVLSDDKCVKIADCGCLVESTGTYIPVGTRHHLEDCSEIQECKLIGGIPKLRAIQINIRCCDNAVCGLKAGIPTCICRMGYTGDGNKGCYPKK